VKQSNEDVQWYVGTRRDSQSHVVINENYMAAYEGEFERIREFDTIDDATKALAARIAADEVHEPILGKERLRSAKIRGDIRKGSVMDEEVRAQIRAELKAELEAEMAIEGTPVIKPTPRKTTKK